MPRHKNLFFTTLLLAAFCLAPLEAQSPVGTAVTVGLNFTGTANGTFGSHVVTLQGTGTVTPYGAATLSAVVDGKTISFNFDFPNGDQFIALAVFSGAGNPITATANLEGSYAGTFAGVDGSFQFTATCQGDCAGTSGQAFSSPFILGGSGVFYFPRLYSQNGLSSNVTNLFASLDTSSGQPAQKQLAITLAVGSQPMQIEESIDTSDCQGLIDVVTSLPSGGNLAPADSLFYVNVNVTAKTAQPGSATCTAPLTISGYTPPTGSQDRLAHHTSTAPIATLTIPINIIVTDEPQLVLSATGVDLNAIFGETVTTQTTVTVKNGTSGDLPFTTAVGLGSPWLTVTPPNGDAGAAPVSMTISADAALVPGGGDYWGQVVVASAQASNSPQVTAVAFPVSTLSSWELSTLSAYSLIFTTTAGTNPQPQTITITTLQAAALPITLTSTFYNGGLNWFTATGGGSVTYQAPKVVTVSLNATGLAAGLYSGRLLVQVGGNSWEVGVTLVVSPALTPDIAEFRPRVAACTPTMLIPALVTPASSFQVTAGLPVAVEVQVVDNCGTALTSGSVVVSFGGGDASLDLVSLGEGMWSGTWWPHNLAGGAASMIVDATEFTPALFGATGISGTVAANATAPIVNAGGVLSAASYAPNTPVAPGSFIAIFGSNLAGSSGLATSLPFPPQLAGTQVFLGNQALALEFVSSGQINAIVPYGVPVNALQQLMVLENGIASPLENILVAPAAPAVFTQTQSGSGIGAMVDVPPSGPQFVVDADHPATAGDALEIYCAGLGATVPAVADGAAAPADSLVKTIIQATVTIGGQPAEVLFSGLAPGFAGLYQVNAVVPSGVPPGEAPLVITIGSASSSSAVTVPIQ